MPCQVDDSCRFVKMAANDVHSRTKGLADGSVGARMSFLGGFMHARSFGCVAALSSHEHTLLHSRHPN